MPEFRITKYDPVMRDSSGAYLPHDWTSISDVGRSTTLAEYMRVEESYLDVALAFLREADIGGLSIHWHPNEIRPPTSNRNGDRLRPPELRAAMQRVLREEMWARFEHESGAFVHFGGDYYMFLGVTADCPKSLTLAAAKGLFVEPFVSPYHPEPEDEMTG